VTILPLSPLDLALASALVLATGALAWRMQLDVTARLLIAALRSAVQLLLVGLVLRALFANADAGWVALVALVMLLAAGREVMARQRRRFTGWWGYGLGFVSMFLSTFAVSIFALAGLIGTEPWYAPRYSIPLLGMLLGNTMTGVALAIERLGEEVSAQRNAIEDRLTLGEDRGQATRELRRGSMRAGLIPIVNAMAAAGIVSLPGMMTGQILAGASPTDAVTYQILILFLIAGSTGLGTLVAVWLGTRRLFDERQRLRLERLSAPPSAG